jgi:hypothetical protein
VGRVSSREDFGPLRGADAVETGGRPDIHTFAPTDCAVVEGMATAGTRKMILFSTVTNNIGPGALVLGPPRLRVAS